MKVGSMVLQDFPEHRHDWREDWPDNFPGIILEENEFSTYTVMAGAWIEEVNIEYLIEVV